MNSKGIFWLELLPTFQNKDDYLERVALDKSPVRRIVSLYLLLSVFSFSYGIVMGSFHSFLQAITAGIKVAVLFNLVLIICFPAFFMIQFVLGSKLRLYQMLSIIFSGFVLTTAIMISFAPIVIFFLVTGSNYYFLQLLHILIFILSGFFGMKSIIDSLKISCEKKNIYPRIGVVVFRFWVIILAFVGIQLAWNLRPFLGDEGKPFKLFRHYEGNFYTALIYSFKQLAGSDKNKTDEKNMEFYEEEAPDDSLIQPDWDEIMRGK